MIVSSFNGSLIFFWVLLVVGLKVMLMCFFGVIEFFLVMVFFFWELRVWSFIWVLFWDWGGIVCDKCFFCVFVWCGFVVIVCSSYVVGVVYLVLDWVFRCVILICVIDGWGFLVGFWLVCIFLLGSIVVWGLVVRRIGCVCCGCVLCFVLIFVLLFLGCFCVILVGFCLGWCFIWFVGLWFWFCVVYCCFGDGVWYGCWFSCGWLYWWMCCYCGNVVLLVLVDVVGVRWNVFWFFVLFVWCWVFVGIFRLGVGCWIRMVFVLGLFLVLLGDWCIGFGWNVFGSFLVCLLVFFLVWWFVWYCVWVWIWWVVRVLFGWGVVCVDWWFFVLVIRCIGGVWFFVGCVWFCGCCVCCWWVYLVLVIGWLFVWFGLLWCWLC